MIEHNHSRSFGIHHKGLRFSSRGLLREQTILCTYNAAIPRIIATDALTLTFIWIFHNKAAGRIAKDQSVKISMAEKKKLTSLFSLRLHEPVVVSPHNVVIG
jgi:hypothetical protein